MNVYNVLSRNDIILKLYSSHLPPPKKYSKVKKCIPTFSFQPCVFVINSLSPLFISFSCSHWSSLANFSMYLTRYSLKVSPFIFTTIYFMIFLISPIMLSSNFGMTTLICLWGNLLLSFFFCKFPRVIPETPDVSYQKVMWALTQLHWMQCNY